MCARLNQQRNKILLIAGEPSGDQLGALLIPALKNTYPDAIIEGIGGFQMISQGMKSLVSEDTMDTLSVMGLFEVLKNLRSILKIRSKLLTYIKNHASDIQFYIGLDAPDFNLPIERKIKKMGIKTLHYVSPSVWAWRSGRIHNIIKSTDSILCILPFEPQFYHHYHHAAVFVGHPLAQKMPLDVEDYKGSHYTIAVLPGSRKEEVKRLLPIFLDAVIYLSKKMQNQFSSEKIIFNISIAKASLLSDITEIIHYKSGLKNMQNIEIHCSSDDAKTLMVNSNLVLLASGTATLEAMLCKRPMIVGYRLSSFTYRLVKFFNLIKIRKFSLPNLLANEDLVPELIQDNLTPETIVKYIEKYKNHPEIVETLKTKFYAFHQQLSMDTNEIILSEMKRLTLL